MHAGSHDGSKHLDGGPTQLPETEASHSPLASRVHSKQERVASADAAFWTHQGRSGRHRRTTVNDQRMLVRGSGGTSSVRDPPPSQSVSPSSRFDARGAAVRAYE